MESAQDFMESYLREHAQLSETYQRLSRPIDEKFLAPDYLKLYLDRRARRQQNPEKLLSVDSSHEIAKVITTAPSAGMPRQYRYHLRRSAASWQIHEIEWECLLCHGSGRRGESRCDICEGTGWRDPLKRDA
jgi:hypothetical protein